MTVAELIIALKHCPADNLVMYDMKNELWNETIKIVHDTHTQLTYEETHFSIDDVLNGAGTRSGFTYLTADRID